MRCWRWQKPIIWSSLWIEILVGGLFPWSAQAQTVEPTSYDMLNGQTGSWTYHDEIYSGSGAVTTDLSPLAGGLGDLTDDVIAGANWNVTEPPAGNGPYVGWQTVNPSITFQFAQGVAFNTITVEADDSNGAGGVFVPATVNITVGANATRSFAVVDPPGSAPVSLPFNVQGDVGNTVVVEIISQASSWIMISEIDFDGAVAVPTLPRWGFLALALLLLAMAVTSLRRRGGSGVR